MMDDESDRIEKGIVALLVRAAKDGDTAAARAVLSRLDNKPVKQKRRRYSKKHSTFTREEYLVHSLAQIESAVQEATDSQSWQAVVNGKRLAVQLRDELDKHRSENKSVDIDPEEAQQRMMQAMSEWPDEMLEHALDVYAERHEAQIMLIRNNQNKVRRAEGRWTS